MAVNGLGEVFISGGSSIYSLNHVIRKIDANGIITTIAGNPSQRGFAGDGGPARDALLQNQGAIEIGVDGSIYFGHSITRIRQIDPQGIINTIAGTGGTRPGVGYPFDGFVATVSAITAQGFEIDPDGSLYFADSTHRRISRITPEGVLNLEALCGDC